MFCKNCGKDLPDDSKFCKECGAKTAPSQPSYQQSPQSVANSTMPPVYTSQQTMPPFQNAYPPQQTYIPPQNYAPGYYSVQTGSEPIRVIQYIGMFLLMGIPVVGLILLFVWSFGSSVNPNKKSFARAILILSLIAMLLSFVFGAIISKIIAGLFSSIAGYY